MKSTGLFGKNSGKVGGVVYSNYRGEQIVRAYQPKVSNPNSVLQVAQRAKFKLMSQIATELKREINASFIPTDKRLTSRNAWIKKLFDKVNYSNRVASLPLEEITLTNSRELGAIAQQEDLIAGGKIQLATPIEWIGGKMRFVLLSYSDGGQVISPLSQEVEIEDAGEGGIVQWSVPNIPGIKRVVIYAYKLDETLLSSYGDLQIAEEDAEIDVLAKNYAGAIRFSASLNKQILQNV